MTSTDQDAPFLELSSGAIERLQTLLAQPGPPAAGVRLQILRRTPDGFEHQLVIIDVGHEPADDMVVEAEGLKLYVEAESARYLEGVRVHYEFKGEGENGFQFTNPNPLWHSDAEMRIQTLFDTSINPSIASHGGFVDLLGVEDSTAYVRLGGGCQGCGLADVTLKQGIATAVIETVPEIDEVVDSTDHDAGTNPYFQPSKK